MARKYLFFADVVGYGSGKTVEEAKANATKAYEEALAERMREAQKHLDENPGDYWEGPESRILRKLRTSEPKDGLYRARIEGEVHAARIRYS